MKTEIQNMSHWLKKSNDILSSIQENMKTDQAILETH